ncbi:MAG: Spo0B domain-containing protein [Solirubrobacterales bacterium]
MNAEQTVQLIRRQRHDFANDLQVIRGYLDLNMPQRALDTLINAVERMDGERRLFETFEPALALEIYQVMLSGTEYGIEFYVGHLEPAVLNQPERLALLDWLECGLRDPKLQAMGTPILLDLLGGDYPSARLRPADAADDEIIAEIRLTR